MAEVREKIRPAVEYNLPFERRLVELETLVSQARTERDRRKLNAELERERTALFSNLTPWQRFQLARHQLRPQMLDYTSRILDDFVELRGDRLSGDDPAVVGGIGRFRGRTVVVVGQQKGATLEERLQRRFGCAFPQGYRKALRLFKLAERLRLPVVTFVDTQGANLGIEAEAHGQGNAIATNLLAMLSLTTPIFSVVIGEGGSGGALGIAVADWVSMLEHSIYVICPPERCAEILWRDKEKKDLAASALKMTANDLKELGIIDSILPEPGGGAHRNPDGAAESIASEIAFFLEECDKGRWSPALRQQKFRNMGVWRAG